MHVDRLVYLKLRATTNVMAGMRLVIAEANVAEVRTRPLT